MNKRTKEEKKAYQQSIYNAVEEMVGKGFSYTEKRKELAKLFSVSERQCEQYIKWYNEERKRINKEQTFNSREDAIAQYDYLYKQAMKDGNKREAKECLDAKIKLMGLQAPKQIQTINANVNLNKSEEMDMNKYSPEQLKAILEAQATLQKALNKPLTLIDRNDE